MNDNLTKLIAMLVVGSVAKSLFGNPVSVNNFTQVVDKVSDAVDTIKS